MHKNVVVIGASGLIGSALISSLCKDESIGKITIIARSLFVISNPKIIIKIIDFENTNQFQNALKDADVIFCAVGTTLKKVKGDISAYRKVDYDIPVNAAKYGKESGAMHFAVVSSYGADSSKSNFYLKLKGEMEDALREMNLPSLYIFRPSLLLGKRRERRLLEDIGQSVLPIVAPLFPSNMRPILGGDVAKAMIEAVKQNKDAHKVYHYNDMMALIRTTK